MDNELVRAIRRLTTAVTEARRKADAAPQFRQATVSAIYLGPPKSMDIQVPSNEKAGYSTIPKVRYINPGSGMTYLVNDVVWVASLGRGRWIILGKLA